MPFGRYNYSKGSAMGRFEHYMSRGGGGAYMDEDDPLGGRMGAIDGNSGVSSRRGGTGVGGIGWTADYNRRRRGLCGGGGCCGGCDGGGCGCKYAHVDPSSSTCKSITFAMSLILVVAFVMALVYEGERTVMGLPPGTDWTGEPENAERFSMIRNRIVSEGLSSRLSTDDKSSPQRLSIKWLTDWDGAQLEVDDPFLIQRYALGVFFFSTVPSGDDIRDVEHSVEAKSSKKRGSGEAVRGSYGTKSADRVHGWSDLDGWMTELGLCMWKGVRCHHRPGTDVLDTMYDADGEVISLNLTGHNLGGSMPSEIGVFRNLRILDLGQNSIAGKIPRTVGNLVEVTTLYLGDNAFTGTVPTEIGQLTECTHLYLDQNALEGPIPTEVNNMVSLQMLGLYENYLTGTIPDMSNLSLLRDLYLDDNDLSGSIPATIGKNKPQLRDLRLSENSLSGTIPLEICDLEVLNILYIHSNKLTGPIPEVISKLRELDEFHAHKNSLSGPLPLELFMLRDLDSLYLDHNDLTGPIPPTIGDLDDVERLYLHGNNLTGTIPTEIERLDDLTHLRFNDNALSGTLPSIHLNRLFKLRIMHLQNNRFRGQIPEELGLLKYLEEVLVQGNQLEGSMPQSLCQLRTEGVLEELQADCGENATSKVYCDCCTACFD